ncbi:MAG TPA: peptide ABC transporter substrate-binding protein [Candidatus Limnocylindrales bacterium]
MVCLLGRTGRIRPSRRAAILGVVALVALAGMLPLAPGGRVEGADRETRIAMSAPATIDPAAAGDAGSAAVIAQLFEGLTAIDGSLAPRPALAASWAFKDGNRTVDFTLRDGLTFSDGTPISAEDVVRSWLRVLDPAAPSPLAALLYDVVGARAYATGASPDPTSVGLHANGRVFEVQLTRPAGDFPAIAASPSLAVVPPGVVHGGAGLGAGAGFVASGAYVLSGQTSTELQLTANDHYWAGAPSLTRVTLVTDLGGKSPVDVFGAGTLDWTPVGPEDASWIGFDRTLGPQLRSSADLAVTYFGFDTRRAPFNDPRVRRAFAEAVDWRRVVRLADGSDALPATGMVPPGIPGRSDADFLPTFDPAAAKRLLADAGYADPAAFPVITLVDAGAAYDAGILDQLHANLGITVRYESLDFTDFFTRLGSADGPRFWALGWVADYPSPYDFLGILLGGGQPNNYGGWTSAAFDDAIARAAASQDPSTVRAAYDQAEAIVRDEAPVVPAAYSTSYALSRTGLLGAQTNGLGILRIAGMAWAPGTP